MIITLISNIVKRIGGTVSTTLFDNADILEGANTNSNGYRVPEGTYLINRSIEITVPIQMEPGAEFSIPVGVTLTISGSFTCGLQQCFTGDGNVIFKPGSTKEAYIQWFGAVSNENSRTFNNSCHAAFNKALLCGAAINVPPGYYYLSHPVEITKPCVINFFKGIFPADPPYPPPIDPVRNVERNNRALVYTDQNIDFFVIKSRSVWIDGGTFDASNVVTNTTNKAVFHYIPQGASNIESYGMRQGGITNFLIYGNAEQLKLPGNGIVGIYIDWINSEANSYMYRHTWEGYMEHVKYGLYETLDGGSGASNSCWHNIYLKVWIAKQALVLNRATENDIEISFQSGPVLDTTEIDLAAIFFKGTYGNQVKTRFVDMLGTQNLDWESIYYLGWSHRYSIEDYTGKNFYVRTNTDVDITERSRKRVAGSANGLSSVYADAMSGVLPSGQQSGIYEGFRSAYYSNTLIAADKRYTVNIGFYQKPAADFTSITVPSFEYGCTPSTGLSATRAENLWNAHTGFTEFYWNNAARDTDYVEIFIDGIDKDFIRFNEFYFSGSTSIVSNSGIGQIHVLMRDINGNISDNILVETEPSYTRTSRYSIPLNDQIQVGSIIIRLIGMHYENTDNSITSVNLSENTLTYPGGLPNDTVIYFTNTGTVTEIFQNTPYYVIGATYSNFQISTTQSGSPVDLRGSTASLPKWNYGIQSFQIEDFAIFKPFNGNVDNYPDFSTAPLLAISGNQRIYGTLKVAGTTASPADHIVGDGSWNGTGLLRLGDYRFWVDSNGKLRMKNGVPISDTDGNIVNQ